MSGGESSSLSVLRFGISTRGISDLSPSTIASRLMAKDPGEKGSWMEEAAEGLVLSCSLSLDGRSLCRAWPEDDCRRSLSAISEASREVLPRMMHSPAI